MSSRGGEAKRIVAANIPAVDRQLTTRRELKAPPPKLQKGKAPTDWSAMALYRQGIVIRRCPLITYSTALDGFGSKRDVWALSWDEMSSVVPSCDFSLYPLAPPPPPPSCEFAMRLHRATHGFSSIVRPTTRRASMLGTLVRYRYRTVSVNRHVMSRNLFRLHRAVTPTISHRHQGSRSPCPGQGTFLILSPPCADWEQSTDNQRSSPSALRLDLVPLLPYCTPNRVSARALSASCG